jgi:hypothetical protein
MEARPRSLVACLRWLLPAAFLSAATAGAAAQEGPEPRTGDSLALLARVPARLMLATRIRPPVQDAAPRTLEGALVGYRQSDGAVTIYLFRETPETLPRGPDSPAVQVHLQDATATMLNVLNRREGAVTSAEVTRLADYRHAPRGGAAFRCVRARRVIAAPPQSSPGEWERTDHLCVTSIRGRFLKLRGTFQHPTQQREALRRYFASMAGQVAATLDGAD